MKPFLIPLNNILSQPKIVMIIRIGNPVMYYKSFEYPAVLQAAINSVVTELTTWPHLPRLTAETDRGLLNAIEIFEEKAKAFYDNIETFT